MLREDMIEIYHFTMVLNRFKQAALMEGFSSIQLEVKERNTRAMDFYKRNGFVPVEYLESFYNDGSSGVRMVCDLGAGYRT